MTQTPLSRRAVLAAASLAVPAVAQAQSPPLGPFRFKGWRGEETDAERGAFMVPEDRRDPASRQIRLTYVRFPSRAARPGPPIVYLAGGPGGTATGTATGPRFPIFMALREVADVIAFDQRGTGASNAIPPAAPREGPLPALTRQGLVADQRAQLARAWDGWTQAGVAMRGYNTRESADDVEALRHHLGAETIDLWGISYGTHLALAILRQHGDRIGRVALASLEGQDQTVKRPARLDAYFRRVDALFGADPDFREAIPDFPALMRRVHAQLEAQPAVVRATVRGTVTELRVGGFAVQMLAGGMIANPDGLAMLPRLYLALDAGKTSVLAPFLKDVDRMLGISGMPEAMDIASGISRARLARVEKEARTAV
ncbi:MAG: alpha/beta hydrolase, partial [Caulobacter sp.]|nr:alpha/beta hydrolase [Caulobacter sp.]